MEIVSDVHLIKPGEKVGGSEATLLAKLGIKPFSYGLVVQQARALLSPEVPPDLAGRHEFHEWLQ